MDMHAHLLSRHLDPSRYHCHLSDDVTTFMLFNLSGAMVGFQQYRPFASKEWNNDPRSGRYFTYVSPFQTGVWGLETFHYRHDVLFVTEGVFDACRLHNYGLPAVAVLSNNPQHLANWLSVLPRRVVAVVDHDHAGAKLASFGNDVLTPPTPGLDLGDLDEAAVCQLLHRYL